MVIRFPIGWIEGFIRSGILEGKSVAQLLTEFREQGGRIRTQTWYDIAREVRRTLDLRDTWNRWEWDRPIGEAQHVPWLGNMKDRFQYKIRLDILDPETGRIEPRYTTVGSDVPLSPEEIWTEVARWTDPEEAEEAFTDPIDPEFIRDVAIVEARMKSPAGRRITSVEVEL